MQPNEQPDMESQHPIDYLDEIATVPKGAGKSTNDKLFFGALFVGLIIALVVGAFAIFFTGDGNKAGFSTLSVRLANLQDVTDSAQKNIVSSKLRAVNTSTSLALTNANRDIGTHLATHGIETKKISPEIIEKESTSELKERLENARLNAIYDRTYAREMTFQLETTLILLREVNAKTKNKSQKEYLETTYNNLQPLHELFAEFDAASS